MEYPLHNFEHKETLELIAECLGKEGREILRTMPRPVLIGLFGASGESRCIAMDWTQLPDCIRRDCFQEIQVGETGHKLVHPRGGLKHGQMGVILAEQTGTGTSSFRSPCWYGTRFHHQRLPKLSSRPTIQSQHEGRV